MAVRSRGRERTDGGLPGYNSPLAGGTRSVGM